MDVRAAVAWEANRPRRSKPSGSTFANHTVLPEIALAKVREDAPFEKICNIGCGVTNGIGAVIYTAKVEPGAPTWWSSGWAGSA
jgi:Zn-dependent alcohol dehydrogenase